MIRAALADGPASLVDIRAHNEFGPPTVRAYADSSIGNTITQMVERGEITRLEPGIYELTPGWH